MDEHKAFLVAARDTLVHIAGVSGTAAKRLRPGQSLDADLGFDAPDLSVLAECQRKLGDRLRRDGKPTRLEPDDLRNCLVWEVFALTVWRAVGRDLSMHEVTALIATVQANFRDGER